MKIDVRDRGWFCFSLSCSNKLRDPSIVQYKPYLSWTCINPKFVFFSIYVYIYVYMSIVKSIVIRLKHNSRE